MSQLSEIQSQSPLSNRSRESIVSSSLVGMPKGTRDFLGSQSILVMNGMEETKKKEPFRWSFFADRSSFKNQKEKEAKSNASSLSAPLLLAEDLKKKLERIYKGFLGIIPFNGGDCGLVESMIKIEKMINDAISRSQDICFSINSLKKEIRK